MRVNQIELQTTYQPNADESHADELMRPKPLHIIKQWIHDRFRATGGAEKARFTIIEASIVEQKPEEKETLFTTPPLIYRGTLRIKLTLLNSASQSLGHVTTTATCTRSLPQSLNFYERQKKMIEMTESMLEALDQELVRNIKSRFPTL